MIEKQLQEKRDAYELKLSEQQNIIKNLQNKLEETTIDTYSDVDFTVEEDSDTECEEYDYQLYPLDIGKGFTIEYRDDDGYVNVTNLCKAGGSSLKIGKN